MLDIDFGTFPYVTSSNPSIGSVLTGLGANPRMIGEVTAIVKAYCTRVGEGPFPTELHGEIEEKLRLIGGEYGTTTGRARRCGWIDIPQLRYAHLLNGFTQINLTKLDVLSDFDEIYIGKTYLYNGSDLESMPASLQVFGNVTVEWEIMPGWKSDISKIRKFEDLPAACQTYVLRLEELIGVPIRWIGVGPARDDMIERK